MKAIYLLLVIPGTILWFIFGSYSIRLGLYLTTCCGLILASQNFLAEQLRQYCEPYIRLERYIEQRWSTIARIFCGLGLLLFTIFSVREQLNTYEGMRGNIFPMQAGKTNIYKYFGQGAEWVYREIYNHPTIKIWAPHRYIKGIFFGHNPIITTSSNTDPAILYQTFQIQQPDYVFTGGVIPSPDGTAIEHLIQLCPKLFIPIPLGKTLYEYQLFRVDPAILKTNYCARRLPKQ